MIGQERFIVTDWSSDQTQWNDLSVFNFLLVFGGAPVCKHGFGNYNNLKSGICMAAVTIMQNDPPHAFIQVRKT